MNYLYTISRRDLPVHQQAIQSGHSQLKYFRLYGLPEDHPATIWLTAENRAALLAFIPVLKFFNLNVSEFSDPDYEGYEISAISCFVPEELRFLFSHFPLWNCYSGKFEKEKRSLLRKLWGR